MKKQEKKTVGVYDRPEKRHTKPIIIAVALALILLLAVFIARGVYSMPHPETFFAETAARQSSIAAVPECDPNFKGQTPGRLDAALDVIPIDIGGALR